MSKESKHSQNRDLYYQEERKKRRQEREFERIKNNLRRNTYGKPQLAKTDLSIPGLLGKFVGRIVVIVAVILAAVILLGGGFGLGVISGWISTTEEIPPHLLSIQGQTSFLYDAAGTQTAELTGVSNINREIVPYAEVADTYIDEAFSAIEDRTFKTNIGIDPRRIIGAVLSTFASGGGAAYGGSTITQQTVKMLTGDNQLSYQRKVQEWYRAIKLTEQSSKSDIMHLYLNLVPMGNNYVGIQSAAKAYFGKEAKDLNLAECALLAGIPQSPATYNPFTELGRKNAQRRQRIVLNAMLEEEHITQEQFEDAMNYELVYKSYEQTVRKSEVLSYFEEYAIRQVTEDLVEQRGYTYQAASQLVNNGGLHIHMTVDPDIQGELDRIFLDQDVFQKNKPAYAGSPELPEAGVAMINNQNNTITALQGGYGPKRANLILNRATDIDRSPASMIKPLAVYAPAVELDIVTGATIVRDEMSFLDPQNPNKAWPLNTYRSFYGNMTVRDCLKISNNVPSVKVLKQVGVENAKYFLKEVGLDLTNDPVGLALATGALTHGFSPLEMADAMSVFAQGGLFAEAKAYSKVIDSQGTVILENDPDYNQVYSAETAYMMSRILEDVLLYGTGGHNYRGTAANTGPIKNANGELISSAGKSGTTDEWKDEWLTLITPYYTCTGWYGFDNRIKQTFITWADFYNIHYIVDDIMTYAHRDLPATEWNQPPGIVELTINTQTGQVAGPNSGPFIRKEYFKAGNELTPQPGEQGINYLTGEER